MNILSNGIKKENNEFNNVYIDKFLERKSNIENVHRIWNNNIQKTNVNSETKINEKTEHLNRNRINKRQVDYSYKKGIENKILDYKNIYYNTNYNFNKKDREYFEYNTAVDFNRNIFLKFHNLKKSHELIISSSDIRIEIERNIEALIKSYKHNEIVKRFNLKEDKKNYSLREISKNVTKEYVLPPSMTHINKQYKSNKYLSVLENRNLVYSRDILKETSNIKNIEMLKSYTNSFIKDAQNISELYIDRYEDNVLKKSFKISNGNYNYTANRLFSIINHLQKMISPNIHAFNKAKNKSNNNIFSVIKNIKNITRGSGEFQEIISNYNINKVNPDTNINSKYYILKNLQKDSSIKNVYKQNFKQIEKRVKSKTWSIDKQQKNHLDIYVNNYIKNMHKDIKDSFNVYIQNEKSLNLINNSYLNEVADKVALSNIDNNYQYYNKKSNYQNIIENALLRSIDIKIANFIKREKHLRNIDEYTNENLLINNDLYISNDYKSYDFLSNNNILKVLSKNYFIRKDWNKLIKNKNYGRTRIEKTNMTYKKSAIEAFHQRLNKHSLVKGSDITERSIGIPLINSNNLNTLVEKREYINDEVHMDIYSKGQINKQDKEYIDKSILKKNDYNYTDLEDRDASGLVLVHKYTYKDERSIQENINSTNNMINKEKVELKNNIENNDTDIMQNITNIDTDSANINNDDKDNKELDIEKLAERMYKDVYKKIEKRLLSEKRRLGL